MKGSLHQHAKGWVIRFPPENPIKEFPLGVEEYFSPKIYRLKISKRVEFEVKDGKASILNFL